MWNSLSSAWKECFEQAWNSYCSGSFPIGAAITDENGDVISIGRNKVYEKVIEEGQVCNNKIAHAEINAILKINNLETNTNRKKYSIYSTMEPCALCFGAIVMSSIKNVHFAAGDGLAGATNLINGNDYIAGKNILINGPFKDLEIAQLVLKTDFVLRRGHDTERILTPWRIDCPTGITIGEEWFKNGTLQNAKESGKPFGEIFDEILQQAGIMATTR
ncbi:nucleoside deaminase [Bacillus sp. SG-1]|uniref:nucleoside deaminase n=1 Tax=Bacillus sp. SG-1 TaxID=161544 RepID=UPI0001543C16|nr:nucleoside deaminase [Bacillus sp. SG-1]EDL64854.1 cytidine/deoxycytidylate deaminase/nudix/methyltransferase domains protein [Bacillus sp. SG-1]